MNNQTIEKQAMVIENGERERERDIGCYLVWLNAFLGCYIKEMLDPICR